MNVKKWVCSILLLAFGWSILGNFLSMELQLSSARKEIKHKLKNGVPDSERVVFTFTDNYCTTKLVWTKPNEFRLGNRFYDVIESQSIADGKRRMECISDIQESKLFAELNTLLGKELSQDQDKSQPIKLIERTIFSPYLLPLNSHQIPIEVDTFQRLFGGIHFDKFSEKHVSLSAPPPKC